jgi:predicted GTPase
VPWVFREEGVVPTLHLCLVDPHRAGHESRYHAGEANLRMADVAVIVKEDTAVVADVGAVRAGIRALNPRARILDTRLPIRIAAGPELRGRRVLAVDDGPTLTHGGMRAGAAELAARRAGAVLVDPRPYARGSVGAVFAEYPTLGPVLPAVGYGPAAPCDLVLLGTPVDLRRAFTVRPPVRRVHYEVEEVEGGALEEVLAGF